MTGGGDPRMWTCLVYLTGPLTAIQGVSYLYLSEARKYEEGRLLCQKSDLDLAKVTSEADIDDLHKIYASIPRSQMAWLGLLYNDNKFLWPDGTPIQHSRWNVTNNEPDNIENERCALVKQKILLWHNRLCSRVYPSLCGPYPILGEYTEYEVDRNSDSTSDDCHSKVQNTVENQRPGKTFAALYRCPLCSKDYGSISGFRGHVIKAHGRSDLRAPDYKLTNETQQTIPTTPPTSSASTTPLTSSSNPAFFSTEQLQGCMLESVRNSLNAIAQNEIHKSDLACEGKMCDIASLLSGSESCLAQITDHLTPTFVLLFSGFGKGSSFVASREQMWAQFHRARTDTKFCDTLHEVIKLHTQESDWNVHMLSQCLLDELVDAVCTKFISSIQSDAETEAKDLTSAENEILFYICGFLIRAITKQSGIESKVAKTLRHLCITSQDTSSAFMTKFRVWTETVNRGGLKVSGDNFFFLVRKMEIICRQQVNTSNLNANSLCVDRLKDSILKDTTVLFYWDKLVTSSEEEKLSVLESIADLFLKLRGRAVVKHIRRQTQKRNASTPKRAKTGKKSNSLRKRLREH